MGAFKDRTGETGYTSHNQKYIIKEYLNSKSCTLEFEDGTVVKDITYSEIQRREIKNPNFPNVLGIGFIGIGNYSPAKNKIIHTYWANMLKRSYSSSFHKRCPTYEKVTVCNDWHNFQNFAKWFDESYNPEIMTGWHLDKDLLKRGNKMYSPEMCCFIPSEINVLLGIKNTKKDNLPPNVYANKGKFSCRLNSKYLGSFENPDIAFDVYKNAKEKHIKNIAENWKNLIPNSAYNALLEYKI